VLYSYHHNNIRKVAQAIGNVIGSIIKSPLEMDERELHEYNLIGFGLVIDSGNHYMGLLDFVDKLSPVEGKNCFIFLLCYEKAVHSHLYTE